MEGRKHTGVVVATLRMADAAEAQAWETRWRGRTLRESGFAFRVSSGYELEGATHVVVHETSDEDVAGSAESMSEGNPETKVAYAKLAEHGPVSDGRTAGAVFVFTDCDDPAAEDEFNEWYSGHLRHTIEGCDFYAATRYVSTDPSRSPSKYLAIYETQSRDPAQVQKDGVDWWVKGGFEGPKAMVLRNEVPGERVD